MSTTRLTGNYQEDVEQIQEMLDNVSTLLGTVPVEKDQTTKGKANELLAVVERVKIHAQQADGAKAIGVEHRLGRIPKWVLFLGPNEPATDVFEVSPENWSATRIEIRMTASIAANSFGYFYLAIGG